MARSLSICTVATLAVLAGLLLGPAAGSAAAARCEGGDRPANRLSTREAERATLCLLNRERSSRGLHRLRAERHLHRAASRHNRLMVRRKCFSHECPGERDLVGRLTAAGYLPCSCSWSVGENIAWGSGPYGTPRRIVRSWMGSSPHRANILNPRFEQIGVAVDRGSPGGRFPDAATYTTDFGSKD